jgi:tRNA-binding EMAP/Myf-like protein
MTILLERQTALVVPSETIVQLDIRVGTVLAASRVPHSKKLIALQVDVGEPQPRCILDLEQASTTSRPVCGQAGARRLQRATM